VPFRVSYPGLIENDSEFQFPWGAAYSGIPDPPRRLPTRSLNELETIVDVDLVVDLDADVVAVVFLYALAVSTEESAPSSCREEDWKVTLSSSTRRGRG